MGVAGGDMGHLWRCGGVCGLHRCGRACTVCMCTCTYVVHVYCGDVEVYVCMYAYVYVYVYVCVIVNLYVHVYVYVDMYVCVSAFEDMRMCGLENVHVCERVCIGGGSVYAWEGGATWYVCVSAYCERESLRVVYVVYVNIRVCVCIWGIWACLRDDMCVYAWMCVCVYGCVCVCVCVCDVYVCV